MPIPYTTGFGEEDFPIPGTCVETPELSAACNYLWDQHFRDGTQGFKWIGEGGTAALPIRGSSEDDRLAIQVVNYLFLGGEDPLDGGSADYPNPYRPANGGNGTGIIAAGWLYDELI